MDNEYPHNCLETISKNLKQKQYILFPKNSNVMRTCIHQPSIQCKQIEKSMYTVVSLPPANKVCEGYVFTGVCLSTGGACVAARGGGMCGCSPGGGMRGSSGGGVRGFFDEIRSMSGRYASYLNAFLY